MKKTLKYIKKLCYPSSTRVLLGLSAFLALAIAIIIFTKGNTSIGGVQGVLLALALNYIACFMFYILQVFIPQRRIEQKARMVLFNKIDLLVENELFIVCSLVQLLDLSDNSKSTYFYYSSTKNNRKRIEKINFQTFGELVERTAAVYGEITNDRFFDFLDQSLINLILKLNSRAQQESLLVYKILQSRQSSVESSILFTEANSFEPQILNNTIQDLVNVYGFASGTISILDEDSEKDHILIQQAEVYRKGMNHTSF